MNWKSKEYWIVIILLFITGIYVNVLRHHRPVTNEQIYLTDIPSKLGEWNAKDFLIDEKTLNILKSDEYLFRIYADSTDLPIYLFIAYFKDQKYGGQIHSPKHCLPGGGWKIIDKDFHTLQVCGSPIQNLKMNKFINSDGRRKELMLYWFWTRSGTITSEYGLKIDLARNALLRRPTDAAFVRINLPLTDDDLDKSLQIATDYIQQIFPFIEQVLPFEK